MKNNKKQCFFRFLKENDCYDKFLNNLNNDKIIFSFLKEDLAEFKKYNQCNFDEILKIKHNPLDCFYWSETKEGDKYWYRLSCLWNTINIKNQQ